MNGYARLTLLPIMAALLMLIGCGEPNSPVGGENVSQFYDVVAKTETRGFAYDFDLEGDRLYVAENYAGVGVYDASDPTDVTLIQRVPTSNRAQYVDAVPELGALIVNVSSINEILFLDSLDQGGGSITQLGSENVNAIVAVTATDSVQSVGFPTMPTVEATVARLLVSDATDGVQVFNVWLDSTNSPFFPDTTLFYSYEENITLNWTGIGENGVTFLGDLNHVAVSLRDFGVGFADISKETEPVDGIWLSDVDTPGEASGLAYGNGYVFVADQVGGLTVIDASNINAPEVVANWKVDGLDHAYRVVVDGDRLALIDEFDGVYLMDISDPMNPELVDFYEVREPSGFAFMTGEFSNLAIVSSAGEGLTTLRLHF